MKHNRFQESNGKPSAMDDQENGSHAAATSEMEVYPFTGMGNLIQYCSDREIVVGGGQWASPRDCPYDGEKLGLGLMIEESLTFGASSSSATFANPSLCKGSKNNEFFIRTLELWTFTPGRSEEQAFKIEEDRLQARNKGLEY
mmetsp:Transcript_32627/g.49931  ORF Transcript_32627/g.49931 Transcript_32627/m.49931 type:complete len:143 (-) Transcript_32627:811-1239(-)